MQNKKNKEICQYCNAKKLNYHYCNTNVTLDHKNSDMGQFMENWEFYIIWKQNK